MRSCLLALCVFISSCAHTDSKVFFEPVDNAILPGILEVERHPSMRFYEKPHPEEICDIIALCDITPNTYVFCEKAVMEKEVFWRDNGNPRSDKYQAYKRAYKALGKEIISDLEQKFLSIGWERKKSEQYANHLNFVHRDGWGRKTDLNVIRGILDRGEPYSMKLCFTLSGNANSSVLQKLRRDYIQK